MPRERLSNQVRIQVLTEAGYRCAVPTCRTILALDIHHLVQVSEEGSNEVGNLIALCPTCHALFHRGEISRDSIYSWKSILVSINYAFDKSGIDNLLLLATLNCLILSGDAVLKYASLIVSGLVTCRQTVVDPRHFTPLHYEVRLTPKGEQLVHAWKKGDRQKVRAALGEADDA